ncbi:unnamed protein product [Pleuronectes platessa]|uniref:Uncharacterized protein n=1 Tax=Pleuronectes platessa TaxID=8262 RepID=A0A9N7TXF2_PLEPL|nr:unnamed protein product [Pleuronectes platessa]
MVNLDGFPLTTAFANIDPKHRPEAPIEEQQRIQRPWVLLSCQVCSPASTLSAKFSCTLELSGSHQPPSMENSTLPARLSQSLPHPFLSMLQPKDMHRATTSLLSSSPCPSLSDVLRPLGPPGFLIVSEATYVSLISIWPWVTAFQSPQQATVGEAAGRSVIDSQHSLP